MALASVLMDRKVIGGVKNWVYAIALISHVNENNFNEIILFDVRLFEVKKETYQIKIYNNSHPYYDSICEDT